MKGSTHLAIGTAIGLAASAFHPFTPTNFAVYISVAAFSALSADLDGPSMLSSKLGKISKWLREVFLWGGALLVAAVAYLFFTEHQFYPERMTIAVMIFLIGFVTKEGIIRNALVSLVGAGLIYWGWNTQMRWLIGLGAFVVWAPWLKHRGMTHTVWALAAWGAIGMELEKQLRLEGIMMVAVAGYFSHLFADTLTPSGVKWLYPLYKKSFKIPFL
ncbi:membrane protein [Paenibacillus chitinolyticus]|uniref:metal-dependent hydrolase n=1 Tax=Paenibacillus chitinolyticus TaxID=79263 RepID=UPI0026E49D47|nr:metal-dependent hydrolase [Paenibacillus chitinolyticus]GKS09656.1 membrane protein [Paenibacillus chitinolyticus]